MCLYTFSFYGCQIFMENMKLQVTLENFYTDVSFQSCIMVALLEVPLGYFPTYAITLFISYSLTISDY